MIERTQPTAARRLRFLFTPLAAAGLAIALSACSADSPTGATPTAPPPAPRALLGLDPLLTSTTTLVTSTVTTTVTTLDNTVSGLLGLLTCSQQDQLRAGKYIGVYGGSITVGDHKLVIPAGALSQTLYITATQQSGTIAEIDFQPHGLKFAKPATLQMSYSSCKTSSSSVQAIVYLNDNNQIVEIRPSSDNSSVDAVTATINHFSGYAVATGRTATAE